MDSNHFDMEPMLRAAHPEIVASLLPRQHDVQVVGRYSPQGCIILPLQGLPGDPLPLDCGRCGKRPSDHIGWAQGHLWIRRMADQPATPPSGFPGS